MLLDRNTRKGVILSQLIRYFLSVELMFQYCVESSLIFLQSFIMFLKIIYSLYQFVIATVTNYHKLSSLNNRNYCLSVLEARSLRSRCQQDWFHYEASVFDMQIAIFSLCLHMAISMYVYTCLFFLSFYVQISFLIKALLIGLVSTIKHSPELNHIFEYLIS